MVVVHLKHPFAPGGGIYFHSGTLFDAEGPLFAEMFGLPKAWHGGCWDTFYIFAYCGNPTT